MDYPKTLSIYSKIFEKPLDAFTLVDWRTVAISALRQLEEALSPPKEKINRRRINLAAKSEGLAGAPQLRA